MQIKHFFPDRPIDPAVRAQAIATGYGNAFEAIRAQVPWRPRLVDGTGARRHVKPSYNQRAFDDSSGQLRT